MHKLIPRTSSIQSLMAKSCFASENVYIWFSIHQECSRRMVAVFYLVFFYCGKVTDINTSQRQRYIC